MACEKGQSARWAGHFKEALVGSEKLKPKHLPAMPYAQIPAFIKRLQERGGMSAFALEFTILTAARSGEVLGAKWSEIDFDAALWSLPPERMKNGFSHEVPLAPRALEILRAMHEVRTSDYVFAGARRSRPLSNMAMTMLMRLILKNMSRMAFGPHSGHFWAMRQTPLEKLLRRPYLIGSVMQWSWPIRVVMRLRSAESLCRYGQIIALAKTDQVRLCGCMGDLGFDEKKRLEKAALNGLLQGDLIPLANVLLAAAYAMNPRLRDKLINMILYRGGVPLAVGPDGEIIKSGSEGVNTSLILKCEKHPNLKSKKQSSLQAQRKLNKAYRVGRFIRNNMSNGGKYEDAFFDACDEFGLSDSRIKALYTEYKKQDGMKPIWNDNLDGPFLG